MANSERYNAHHRDLDLIEFSIAELIDRYNKGLSLTWQQYKDVKRVLAARAANAQAAE